MIGKGCIVVKLNLKPHELAGIKASPAFEASGRNYAKAVHCLIGEAMRVTSLEQLRLTLGWCPRCLAMVQLIDDGEACGVCRLVLPE